MRKSIIAAIIIILIIVVGGAIALNHKSTDNSYSYNSTGSSPSASHPSQIPSTGTINIKNMIFSPSQISIQKGGTVTWTNNDNTSHTVVDDLSNVGGPSSGDIAPGSSYSFTFTKAGSYQYHCRIHPSMRGTIVVK
jgi:plastocyanin